MSLKETIRNLLNRNTRKDLQPSGESNRGVSVQFYDLREEAAAEERGLAPGYYLTVHPIFEPDLKDRNLIPRLTFSFFETLKEQNLLESSDTHIPIDTNGQMAVDPAQSWLFSPSGYIPEMQLLVVRADHVDRDDAQRVIVTALR